MTDTPTPAAEIALSEAELLPCPFCGHPVAMVRKQGLTEFLCSEEGTCRGSGLYSCCLTKKAEMAVAQWNTRAAHPRPPEPVLAEALKTRDRALKYAGLMSRVFTDIGERLRIRPDDDESVQDCATRTRSELDAALAALAAQPAPQAREGEEDVDEDDIAGAIGDSMDMDWTSSIGARAVMKLLREKGLVQ